MTIVEEHGTTQVLPPRTEPEAVVRPAPTRPEPKPTHRRRPVRWLGLVAGFLLIALAGAVAISLIAVDDAQQTTLTTADINEARMDARYDGPAQLPGGVLPENLMPLYDNPAQLPGGVLPPNLAPDLSVETTMAVITEARMDARYDGPAQLPGGVLPENLMPRYDNPAQLPGGVLPANLTPMPDASTAISAEVPANVR